MPFLEMLAQQGANVAGQAASGGLGLILGGINDRRQIKQQQKLQDMQISGQKQMTDYNTAKQLQMWKDTSYKAQREQMEKAGINPALMYGMGGGGGQTAQISQGNVSGGQAPTGGREVQDLMGMGIQMQLLQAQKRVLESQADKNEAEAEKTKGVDTENIKADTQNKILQQVVTDFTGKEAKETFERIKHPNRSIEAKTYEDELAARQGVAGTIYEMWIEGKLSEKSLNEIEQTALTNAKTRAETANVYKTIDLLEQNIQGQKLNNIITELESKLQTQTGIDRNSPTWLKILGRLFVELTQQK